MSEKNDEQVAAILARGIAMLMIERTAMAEAK